jgi:mono/diheme cytochrome c family protein
MKMKNGLIAFVLLFAIIMIIFAAPSLDSQAMEERASIKKGKQLYTEICSGCHGENGEGEGGLSGTSLNNQQYLSTFSNEEIFNSIYEGKPQTLMPEFSFLDEQKVYELVSFVRSWQTKPLVLEAPNIIEGNAENGKQLYQLYCVTCHGDTGSGMLTKAAAIANPATQENLTGQQLWISAAYGREGTRMGPSLKGKDGVRQLDKQELSDIVTYIREDLAEIYDPGEHAHGTHKLMSESSSEKNIEG